MNWCTRQIFLIHYRKLLIRHTLTAINEGTIGMHQQFDVLLAIRWIKQAWEEVSVETVMNCFKHCGSMPTRNQDDLEDLFADLDTQESNVPNLDDHLASLNSDITALEYVNQEEDLPTCLTLDETNEGTEKKFYEKRLLQIAMMNLVMKKMCSALASDQWM